MKIHVFCTTRTTLEVDDKFSVLSNWNIDYDPKLCSELVNVVRNKIPNSGLTTQLIKENMLKDDARMINGIYDAETNEALYEW